jgi:hypothetical protein
VNGASLGSFGPVAMDPSSGGTYEAHTGTLTGGTAFPTAPTGIGGSPIVSWVGGRRAYVASGRSTRRVGMSTMVAASLSSTLPVSGTGDSVFSVAAGSPAGAGGLTGSDGS